MVQTAFMILRNPIKSILLLYSFCSQSLIIILQRVLLPHFPSHQSLRIQLQRAYQAAATLTFPDFTHRLPVSPCPDKAAKIDGEGWSGYIIPARKSLSTFSKDAAKSRSCCVALFAHGGGYARGEARMYLKYMFRWEVIAAKSNLDLVFLSVEYPLSTQSPHPAQRNAFIAAYQYLLNQGVDPKNIIFAGDSAGGGLSILSAVELFHLNLPQPAGSVLMSPWIDMSLKAYNGGNSNVLGDYFLGANEAVPQLAAMFRGSLPGTSSEVNPLYRPPHEISFLNPQLIFVGGAEFALQDSKEWAALCEKANVKHKLIVEWGHLHVYALGSDFLDPRIRSNTDTQIIGWILECIREPQN
ncbi:Alpha/Beta hydrolase protein [Xylogone sp. PMI_703]|nr:Alpha/Beta hydrolase protein [Xylogone sp. PMI_703]